MDVDIGNALADVASPGVSRESLERLDDHVAAAHERIQSGRDRNEHGYTALNLPHRTDPDEIYAAVEAVADATTFVTVGIGGSALGAATITNALSGSATVANGSMDTPPGSNTEPATDAIYLDNVDPDWIEAQLESLALERTAINVVSKSGTTAETLANFLVLRDAFDAAGVDWTDRTIVTTGESGPLKDLADRHDLPTLKVPTGVPGRFAALSPVGLVAAAHCGHDIEAILAGGAQAAGTLTGSLFDCPAYAYGATAYALGERGVTTNVAFPYAESLETFAEWFAQLWAESLGKDGLGQTPVRALGVTDQHSQLQLYRAGPRDKLVTFVTPRNRSDRPISDGAVDVPAYLNGTSLEELITAEFEATEASLAAAGRPNVRIELDRVSEHELGALLFGMEAACILVGELTAVDPFDQPAVEWAKTATRGLLGGADDAADTLTEIETKTTLRVER